MMDPRTSPIANSPRRAGECAAPLARFRARDARFADRWLFSIPTDQRQHYCDHPVGATLL